MTCDDYHGYSLTYLTKYITLPFETSCNFYVDIYDYLILSYTLLEVYNNLLFRQTVNCIYIRCISKEIMTSFLFPLTQKSSICLYVTTLFFPTRFVGLVSHVNYIHIWSYLKVLYHWSGEFYVWFRGSTIKI